MKRVGTLIHLSEQLQRMYYDQTLCVISVTNCKIVSDCLWGDVKLAQLVKFIFVRHQTFREVLDSSLSCLMNLKAEN